MWIVQPLEIKRKTDTGDWQHTGKWRLTAISDEDGGGPYGLCEHEHDTPEDAANCAEARQEAQAVTGVYSPPPGIWRLQATSPEGHVYQAQGRSYYDCVERMAESYSQDMHPDRDIHGGMN
jgi:hypothetical protein